MGCWRVVAVEPTAEGRVSRRAADLEIEAYVPVGKRLVRTRARHQVVLAPRRFPAIPGYVFVNGGRVDQYRRDWEQPDTVAHCLRFLGVDRPQTISDEEIEVLREREAKGEFDAENLNKTGRFWAPRWLRIGKAVRIIEGPLRGMAGRVQRITARQTVGVGLILMGREVMAELSIDAVIRVR